MHYKFKDNYDKNCLYFQNFKLNIKLLNNKLFIKNICLLLQILISLCLINTIKNQYDMLLFILFKISN